MRAQNQIYQILGNFVSYSGTETEFEGTSNVDANHLSYRTSGLKDWYVLSASTNTSMYVNDVYTVSVINSNKGWKFTSSDGFISKNIVLNDQSVSLDVNYELDPSIDTLYVRNGLSPNLLSLIQKGQNGLQSSGFNDGFYNLSNETLSEVVGVTFQLGANAFFNEIATDSANSDFISMRNQAQVEQLEIYASDDFNFSISFGLSNNDMDDDGMSDSFEISHNFLSETNSADSYLDYDADGSDNYSEYIAGTLLTDSQDIFEVKEIGISNSYMRLKIPTKENRSYYLWEKSNLLDERENSWQLMIPLPLIWE